MGDSATSFNANLSQAIGNLKSFEIADQGVFGLTENENFKVLVYDHGIIRIHVTFNELFDDHSYAVISTPKKTTFTVDEDEEIIRLTTSTIEVRIQKYPVRFSFYTLDGQVINEDDTFGISRIGDQITSYKKLQPKERFIGLGEKTGPLDRRGRGYQHWNTDNFAYSPESDPLYCSTPFYMGIHNGLAYGLFLDNSHKSHFNFGASNDRFSSISVDSGDINYYFIYERAVAKILESYSFLTGLMPMPPKWSLGYQQCRYSYYPDKEVLSVAQTFRDKDIPADVIVLDIHYMDGYKIFSWDEQRFPDPAGMIKALEEKGFKVVLMCDPGIKIEEGYEPYHSGIERDIFIKYPDNTAYSGEVWPGWCHFPDFTNPETRAWWKEKLKSYTDIGIEGFWNDMNEIATWGHMLPELIEFNFEGIGGTTRKARNIYGLQMARSTFEATKSLLGKRPFNLTRAGFSGIQRYATVWTGDNVSNDEHMMLGVRLVNSMGLAGIAFAGYDVGGFVGNANEHLFARWIQIGVFSPFFRGHSMVNSRDSEPWAYGEEVEEISRNFIKLRYKLMPYIYSLFKEASQTGMPVSRSLAIDYTHDDMIYNGAYQQQYLFGPSILVAPVESYKQLTKVYLPQGEWYDFFTDKIIEGGQEIFTECYIEQLPVYVRASAIIPILPKAGINTTVESDTLELHIYKGTERNDFTYYEDDGSTYVYEEGEYYERIITYEPDHRTITLGKVSGNFATAFKTVQLYLHGFTKTSFHVDKEPIALSKEEYQFVDPISNFDPVGFERIHRLKIEKLTTISLTNRDEEIKITW